ncbi:MAG: carbamoyltransferase [Pirellulales bacterium]
MVSILGISALYHDSAAALLIDGKVVAAAQEERFTRVKHDASFPGNSIDYCLSYAGLTADELDYVCFYEKPLVKLDRLLESYLAFVPKGYRSFRLALPSWLKQKLHVRQMIRQYLPGCKHRPVFIDHHQAHAASAFFPSPFEDAAILTIDGVGEWSTSCIGSGSGNRIDLQKELRFPHSLGLLYSAFTYHAGFRVNSGEYKLMGLAPYGEPRFRDLILQHLIQLKPDGSFRLNMSYFDYCHGLTMTSKAFDKRFAGPPRNPESPITQREMDLAASIQQVTEEICLKMACEAHRLVPSKNLVMAGGVALNCVSNGKLRDGPFDQIWIQPAAGDAGGRLGSAYFVWHQLLNHSRKPEQPDSQMGSLLGPAFDRQQIQTTLDRLGAKYRELPNEDELCDTVAKYIADQLVVGWFQGRMEFGPRALGARSILGDARSPTMQSIMNQKIKFRESFRPFAPVVLVEKAHHYFQWQQQHESPYMLMVAPVREEHRCVMNDDQQTVAGFKKLIQVRSTIPAVTHVDNSSRIQTVDRFRNPLLHRLLTSFDRLTSCPLMINTSFNVRGEPIVCTPDDAYRCFMGTDIDVLVLDRFILLKSEQPTLELGDQRQQYLNQFQLD